jgi:glycosyltransferase involved in cell wall biosynthesis
MKKIGIIIDGIVALGGAERVTQSLLEALLQNVYEINIYLPKTTSDEKIKLIFGDYNQKIRIHKIFQLKTARFQIYSYLINRILLTGAGNSNDVVIETSGSMYPLWYDKKPYLAYFNGLTEYKINELSLNYTGFKKFYWYPYSKIVSWLKRRTNVTLISNSQFTYEMIKQKLELSSKMIYPPVDLKKFQNSNVTKMNKIVTIGRYSQEKNLEFLFTTISKLIFEYNFIGNISNSKLEIYDKFKKLTEKFSNIKLHKNVEQEKIKDILAESKVYFHSSVETFGISVIEAISADCIPIVPDNSAHKETVPFEELRYKEDDMEEAIDKINSALNGKYDHYLPELKNHIKKFEKDRFQKEMTSLIDSVF